MLAPLWEKEKVPYWTEPGHLILPDWLRYQSLKRWCGKDWRNKTVCFMKVKGINRIKEKEIKKERKKEKKMKSLERFVREINSLSISSNQVRTDVTFTKIPECSRFSLTVFINANNIFLWNRSVVFITKRFPTIQNLSFSNEIIWVFFKAVSMSVLLCGCTPWTLEKPWVIELYRNYSSILDAIVNKSWK